MANYFLLRKIINRLCLGSEQIDTDVLISDWFSDLAKQLQDAGEVELADKLLDDLPDMLDDYVDDMD